MKTFFRNLKGVLVISGCTLNTVVCFIPLMMLAIVKLLLPIQSLRMYL